MVTIAYILLTFAPIYVIIKIQYIVYGFKTKYHILNKLNFRSDLYMSIQFIDNSAVVKEKIKEAAIAALYEIGGEIQAETIRNSRTDNGDTKNSYRFKVIDENGKAWVAIGSNLENAIWEEFGTGEYAVNGDGRKGGWYIHESQLSNKAKGMMKKVKGKDGNVFYFTKGKKPNKPLKRAFDDSRDKIQRIFESKFKDL